MPCNCAYDLQHFGAHRRMKDLSPADSVFTGSEWPSFEFSTLGFLGEARSLKGHHQQERSLARLRLREQNAHLSKEDISHV